MSIKMIAALTVLGLGVMMTFVGLASIFTGKPYPELATAGITAVLSSGLVATVGK